MTSREASAASCMRDLWVSMAISMSRLPWRALMASSRPCTSSPRPTQVCRTGSSTPAHKSRLQAVPWDPIYLDRWSSFVAALAAHLDSSELLPVVRFGSVAVPARTSRRGRPW